jgi:hypothetical protein
MSDTVKKEELSKAKELILNIKRRRTKLSTSIKTGSGLSQGSCCQLNSWRITLCNNSSHG